MLYRRTTSLTLGLGLDLAEGIGLAKYPSSPDRVPAVGAPELGLPHLCPHAEDGLLGSGFRESRSRDAAVRGG